MSNFNFLLQDYPKLYKEAVKAEQYVFTEPRYSVTLCRKLVEQGLHILFDSDNTLTLPYKTNIGTLLYDDNLRALIKPTMHTELDIVRKIGNIATHQNKEIKDYESLQCLKNTYRFLRYISIYYGENLETVPRWDEEILHQETEEERTIRKQKEAITELEKEREKIQAEFDEAQEKIKQSSEKQKEQQVKENELTERRKEREKEFEFEEVVPLLTSEKDTRLFLIDLLLREAGWSDLKDGRDAEFKVTGMPESTNKSGVGYVDYVLWGKNGKPLALVEAKSTIHSVQKGKHQAKLYADCLEKEYGQRPIIYYTNGYTTHIWDDLFYPERKVTGFHTQDELKLMIERRTTRKDIRDFKIDINIAGGQGRTYQLEAIKRVAESFVTIKDNELRGKSRKSLLVMATGSGKTRTSAAIVDMLTKCNWAKRILFLADRNALVKQAKKTYKQLLPNLSAINLTKEKEDLNTRVVFSTYPTMLNAINSTNSDEEKLFGVGHFDVVIIDEAHRSVYRKYGAIFEHFDSLLIGLTATPVAEVDRSTYELFGLEKDNPTFAYELESAVKDGFLVPYEVKEVPIKFPLQGVKYAELSDDEKEEYEEKFGDPSSEEFIEEISGSHIHSWLFNTDTVDKVLEYVMKNGIKVKGGDKLGKTIIFARNHKHAIFIQERFDFLFPEYSGEFLSVIDNYNDKAQDLLEKFVEDKIELPPQIAVSVDMMDTGVDAPRVVNLVFFKTVRSKTKFWQMIGRGTRLREDLFGPGEDKEHFLIFDFLSNFEFFDENPDGYSGTNQKSLSTKLFELRLLLVLAIFENSESEEDDISFAEGLIQFLQNQVLQLNEQNINVRHKLEFVHKYKKKDEWLDITLQKKGELIQQIAPLTTLYNEDEKALRFDFLVLALMLEIHQGDPNQANRMNKIIQIATKLEKDKKRIPAVAMQLPIIREVQTEKFWKSVSNKALENIRVSLRDLIQYLVTESMPITYTNFEDELKEVRTRKALIPTESLKPYRDRVEDFIRKNRHNLVIDKLYHNQSISKAEWQQLEEFLYTGALENEEKFKQEFDDLTLGRFVRKIVGVDQQVVNELFSDLIQDKQLTPNQITFVNKIIEYVSKNGYLDKQLLTKQPFNQLDDNGIIGVFKDNEPIIRSLVQKIDSLNDNAKIS